MSKVKSVRTKKIIPFDQPIKIALLFFHFIGFSVWFGGIIIGGEVPAIFAAMTTISGVILVIRELYKDGFFWLATGEGALTLVKVAMLFVTGFLKGCESYLLPMVLLSGVFSSHLPKEVRKKGFCSNDISHPIRNRVGVKKSSYSEGPRNRFTRKMKMAKRLTHYKSISEA